MKRKVSFFLVLMMVMALVTACSPNKSSSVEVQPSSTGTEETIKPLKWIISVGDTEDYYMAQFMKKWMGKVTEKSNGAITGEIYYGGQIGCGGDAYEALDMGNMHIYLDGVSAGGEVNDAFNIFGLPYLYDSKEHQHNFWDRYFDEATDYMAKESEIRVVGIVDGLNREATMNRPINSIEDFKNVKMRVSSIGSFVDMWAVFGAKPIPIGFYEVFTAIQTGVVDGQENDIALSKSAGFFEVAPYLIMTDHNPYEGGIFMDEKYYQSLPEDVKKIMREASLEIYDESKKYCETLESDILEELKEKGVKVMYPDQEPFKEASKVLYDNPKLKDYQYLLDLINKARS